LRAEILTDASSIGTAAQRAQDEAGMSIRSTVITQIQEIAQDNKKSLPPLTDELVLLDSGLDSLAIAILVARLEETLGFDPFTESDDIYYPVTLGDFIKFYENASNSRDGDPGQAR
jgi:acyl carrier protein